MPPTPQVARFVGFREILAAPGRLPVAEAPAMTTVPPEHALAYATPGVRTAPRRTVTRVLARSLCHLVRGTIGLIQALLLLLGYAVIVGALHDGAVLAATAAVVLVAGRVSGDGGDAGAWVVRTFDRTWIGATRRLRRRGAVPLAPPLRVEHPLATAPTVPAMPLPPRRGKC